MTFNTYNSRDIAVMHNQAVGERQKFWYLITLGKDLYTRLFDERDDESTMQVYEPGDSEFLSWFV